MTPEVKLDPNNHALLAFRCGTKYVYAIALSHSTVRVLRMPKTEQRHMRPATFQGKPYPLARAVSNFRRIGKTLGITKSAAKALRSIKAH